MARPKGPLPLTSTARREKFAQEIAAGKTQLEAAKIAGYRPNAANAGRIAKQPLVAARVANILAERSERGRAATERAAEALALDRGWVLANLKENALRASREVPVLDAKGKPTGEYRYDGAVVNRALELIGKELGMFIERRETVNFYGNLSDNELDAAIEHFERRHDTEGENRISDIAH